MYKTATFTDNDKMSEQPKPADYRIDQAKMIKGCVARKLTIALGWSPAVYYEIQCGIPTKHDNDICIACQKKFNKAAETGKHGAWNGRITEEPPDWCHMLGTKWSAKCKWTPRYK